MANHPNRHLICFTARDVSASQYRFGKTWEGQDAPEQVICGSLVEAQAILQARIASDAAPVAAGLFRNTEMTNHRLHSWYQAESAPWNVDPLGRALNATGGRW